MNIYKKDFEDFWKREKLHIRINNAERFHTNLSEKISELGNVADLDHYVCSLKKGREITRKVVVDFYRYLEHCGIVSEEIKSDLLKKRFYDYPFERQLEIAKYLHEKRTPAEIQEHFDIDERTMRKDLQELEAGITVLGSTIQIKKEKEGRKYYYRTTLHPVFLPLNLTEVYALTTYLDRVIEKSDPNGMIIRNISARIKSQLSDYAMEHLFPEEFAERGEINHYIDDKTLATQRDGICCYLMKSGKSCSFFWKDKEYRGKIGWSEGEYQIELEDGEILEADLADVEFIIGSLEYE